MTTAADPMVWYPDGRAHTPTRPAVLRHRLAEHPLLQLAALRVLARRLMTTGQTKFIAKDVQPGSAFSTLTADVRGRTVDETFDDIETPGSWISMYNVETEPEYREMLWSIVGSTGSFREATDPGVFDVGGFIFVSAPPSVTPFHIDRENNFLLQIRGRKHFRVWDPADRATVPLPAVERFIVHRDLADVRYDPSCLPRALDAELGPGEGVYMPSTAPHLISTEPHWVAPGNGVSVTIGVVFYTGATRRAARRHALNQGLRRLGLTPAEPGRLPAFDAMLSPAASAYVAFRRTFRGFDAPPGF